MPLIQVGLLRMAGGALTCAHDALWADLWSFRLTYESTGSLFMPYLVYFVVWEAENRP